MFEHDAEETRRAAQLEAELTASRTAAGIDAGMPLDEWITAMKNNHAEMTRKGNEIAARYTRISLALYEIDRDVFGPLTCKEGIAELLRQRDEWKAKYELAFKVAKNKQDERDEMTRQFQALVDDIECFPGEFYGGTDSVLAASEYLEAHK